MTVLVLLALAVAVAACSGGVEDDRPEPVGKQAAAAGREPGTTTSSAIDPSPDRRVTVACTFRDLVGVVVIPDQRRIEILETNQEFAGDTGLPATGVGTAIAALTPDGLATGNRCRERRQPPRSQTGADLVGPWPETVGTWLRALWGEVTLAATRFRGGYRLSIGPSVRASLLPAGAGGISFSP